MKKAFTLSEMLVCLAVISALLAIFLSTLRVKPNNSMVMFRKAYNTTASVVHEMVQSPAYYETGLLSDIDQTSEPINGEKPTGSKKFCKVFVSFLNTVDEPDCNAGGTTSFATSDGIVWQLPTNANFTSTSGHQIIVDVNGENAPNCDSASCEHPDQFTIWVRPDGKLFVQDETTRNYLKNTRHIAK